MPFNVKMAIKKRKEHGCGTWLFLLDLVKAFDRVPRELLWQIMERFGYPPKLVGLLKALHERVLVNFEVEGVEKVIESIIGAKQGDLLGPILFNIYGAAVMIAWRKVREGLKQAEVAEERVYSCVFRTKQDHVLGTGTVGNKREFSHGGKYDNKLYKKEAETFEIDDSVYADDTAALFCSRGECERGIPPLIDLITRFGGEVHVKHPGQVKESKSVVVFIANQACEYERYCSEEGGAATYGGADLSDIEAGGGCTVAIVNEAKYLGSWIDRTGGDELDIERKITAASEAFGALGGCVFRSPAVSEKAKAAAYVVIVVKVLLHGRGAWALTTRLWQRLRSFHMSCVRTIGGINMWHVQEYHISSEEILERTGIRSIETYAYRRQLRWLGHVSRMPWDRLPRKFLSSWVHSPRPSGG